MGVRVILADDHQIVREGLRALLSEEEGLVILAEAEDGRRAVELSKKLSPDVVILDVSMPDLNGVEAARQIISENGGTKVLVLSAYSDRRYIAEALKAGACGYVLKECACEELFRAIRCVAAGKIYLGAGVADVVVEEYLCRFEDEKPNGSSPLTPRERKVLGLLADGMGAKEIALKLGVSARTIEVCRKKLMGKLGVGSVAGLTRFAIREGLTSLGA
jgi:DNA-binding NarL/FixJ family response regulator